MIYTSTSFDADSLLATKLHTRHADGTISFAVGRDNFTSNGYLVATADELRAVAAHFTALADALDAELAGAGVTA